MSVRRQRIAICADCGCQVSVSKNFKGFRVLCKKCRNCDHTHDTYEADCDEFEEQIQLAKEDPCDVIYEDHLDLPPISSIVRPRDWIVKLDIRGSRKLAHYDSSHLTPSSDK